MSFLLEEILHTVKESFSDINQVSSIILTMKQFAHIEQDFLSMVDINNTPEQTATISKNEWKCVTALNFDFDKTNSEIEGYPSQLNQVFLNVIVNAAYAIGERKEKDGRKEQIMIKSIKEEDNVAIQLLDDGCSIPPGIIDKMFAPVGKGTTFTLLLPIKHSC